MYFEYTLSLVDLDLPVTALRQLIVETGDREDHIHFCLVGVLDLEVERVLSGLSVIF
jgi:hypothetical protein